jgi:hypothetical protein
MALFIQEAKTISFTLDYRKGNSRVHAGGIHQQHNQLVVICCNRKSDEIQTLTDSSASKREPDSFSTARRNSSVRKLVPAHLPQLINASSANQTLHYTLAARGWDVHKGKPKRKLSEQSDNTLEQFLLEGQ